MNKIDQLAKTLIDSTEIKDKKKTSAYDTNAKVLSIDGNTAWVSIEGGVPKTPATMTVSAKEGDDVRVRVSGGKAYIIGNVSNPPTDDTKANIADKKADVAGKAAEVAWDHAESAQKAADIAWDYADEAHEAAEEAWNYADSAHDAADEAWNQANRATGYANDALTQLGVVEEVVDVLSWISEHGTYKKSTDTEVIEHKMYFTLTGTVVVPETYDDDTKVITNLESYYEKVNDVYVKTSDTTYNPSKTYYTVSAEIVQYPTGNPSEENYYEIFSVDKAVQNYISSHLALTDSGLWVVKDNQGYKVLLSNEGLQIYDDGGHLVSTFGENITFDAERPQKIGNNSTYVSFYDSDNDGVADKIEISGDVNITNTVTIGGQPQSDYLNSNIQVGARNLLKNSEVSLSTLGGNTNGGTTTKVIPEGSQITVSVMVDADNVVWDTTTSYRRIGCEMSLPKSGGGYQYVGVWAGKEIWDSANIVAEFTGSFHGRVSKTFTLLADIPIDKACTLYIQGVDSGSVTVSNIKFEVGNKATDWAPAPEDVQAEIDAKKNVHSLTSASAGASYATILGWVTEGASGTWGVTSNAGVKVGDTVRIAYKATDMGADGTIVYPIGTVTAIPNSTSITMTAHGLDTTVIDGGHILTGTIDANKVNISNLTVGAFGAQALSSGGKNILSGTRIMLNGGGSYASNTFRYSGDAGFAMSSTFYPSAQMPAPNLYRALKVTNTASTAGRKGFAQDSVPINIASGTYLTMSLWIRASADNLPITLQPIWFNSSGPYTRVNSPNAKTTTSWQYVTETFIVTTAIQPSCSASYVYVDGIPSNGWFEVTGLKLEIGSIPTEWTDDIEFEGTNLAGPGSDLDSSLMAMSASGAFSLGVSVNKRCAYTNGELNVSKSLMSSRTIIPKDGEFFTMSCDLYLSNYQAGTTNPYVALYFGGSTNTSSGSWIGPSYLLTTINGVHTSYLSSDNRWAPNDLNGKGWVHCETVGYIPVGTGYTSAFNVGFIYARDFTGLLCARNFKLERGYKATPWTPAAEHDVVQDAATKATNYITHIDNNGIRIHPYSTQNNSVVINASGMEVFKGGTGSDNSVAFYGDTARVGLSGKGRVDIAPSGIDMYGYNANASPATQNLCHIGFANGNAASGQAIAPYFTFGTRASGSSIGNYSVAEGYNTTASHWASHAEGGGTKASNNYTHAEGSNTTASAMYAHAEGFETTASDVYAHAEGYGTKATNDAAHAEGYETQANGYGSHAQNVGTVANGTAQTVIGKYNVADTTSLFIVGKGSESSRSNAFAIGNTGNVYVNGTQVHSSDRRLKEHISYLGDEAIDFINGLKPAHYTKDGEPHVGFYAQDVEEVDKWDCMTGEMNGYMTLGYMELIAPLVAYVQRLEERIAELERSR